MAEGSDLLRLAVAKGDRSLARTLLSEGLTAAVDKDGRNILHIAAQNGHLKMVQTLIHRGFDIQSQDNYGYTPLHRASAQGYLEVIEFLLNSGCPIDQQDEFGNTALHAASWNGFSQTVALLLKKKANINACNKAGFTALHSAGQKGHNQTARVLLYAACRMNARNKYGDTPLHTSTQHGHAGVVRILLSAKCKVNIQNKNGETALHKAAINKRYKIAKLLLEAGIKKKLKNKQSETALDISKKLNDSEMVLMITSEEKLTKFPFMMRQHRSNSSCHSVNADDKASGASDVGRMKKSIKSQQELGTGNLVSSSGRVATNSSFAFIRSRSSPELSRRQSDRQSHVTPRHTFEFSRHQIPKSEVKFIAEGIAESAHRHSSSPPHPALPSLSKPGHIYYRDLSGKLKQGPVGCICSDSLLPATMCQKINKTYEDLYEPLAQMKKSHSVSRKPSCQQFSNLSNSNNLLESNWKLETRIHGKSNTEAEKPRGHSRSRSTDFYQKKNKSCDTRRRSAAGSCEHCHGNLPTSSVNMENCLNPQNFVHGEKKADMTIYSGQPFQSRSDETISTHLEQRQKQLSKYHHHVIKIPNADCHSSDESNHDWMISDAPGHARGGNCETFDWLRTSVSNSFGRRTHLRRTRNKDDFYHLDVGGSYVPPSRPSYNHHTSENKKNEASNAFKENRNSSTKISVAEHCRNLGNNARCPKVKKEQSGALQHYCDAPSLSTDDHLLCGKSKEHVLMASSMQSALCKCVVSCPNRLDSQSFCPVCMHKSLNSTCRADTGSNHDSGYGSKIYHNMSDCIAYSQHPTEAKCKDDDKNSVQSGSKEFVSLSGLNCNKISKISAGDQVMNKNHIKRVSRHTSLHTNFETAQVDVYHQQNCSLTVGNAESTPRHMYNQSQANGGSDLSIVSEHSDCQMGQSEHFDIEDFDQHRTLALSNALADKSIDYIDAVNNSFELDQKHEAI